MSNVKLSKIRFINWHKCDDSGILDISGSTMFSGATGSGKSTAIDAIYSTLFVDNTHFNKAANSKSKRNLKGYIRCQVNELKEDNTTNKYQRTGNVICYILIEIISEKNQRNVIGVCHRSPNENADIDSYYFAIGNCKIEDVGVLDNDNAPLEWKAFKNKYECDTSIKFRFVNKQSDAKQLFASQLGFGNAGKEIYEKYGKAVANAIAFRPDNMDNINTFFKSTLLKEDTIDITTVKESYEKYEEVKRDVDEQEKRCDALKEIKTIQDEIININNALSQINIAKLIAEQTEAENQLGRLQENKIECEEEKEKLKKKSEFAGERIKNLVAEKARLEDSDETHTLNRMRNDRDEKKIKLSKATDTYNTLINAVMHFNSLIDKINEMTKQTYCKVDVQTLFSQNNGQYLHFLKMLEEIVEQLRNSNYENNQKIEKIRGEHDAIGEEIKKMEQGIMTQNRQTNRALDVVNEYYKSLRLNERATLLYQCIDIKPECAKWQYPIEALLNNARFNMVVDPVHYNKIAKLFKENGIENVSLIDTTALEAETATETPSICDMLLYHNKYAERYIKYRYGRVIPVETCVDLPQDKNKTYIGADGTHYATKAFNVQRRDIMLCIGENTRLQAIKDKKEEREEKRQLINEIHETIVKGKKLIGLVSETKDICSKIEYETYLLVKTLPGEIEALENDIYEFETKNDLFLIADQIKKYEKELSAKEEERKLIEEKIGQINTNLGGIKEKIEKWCETLTCASNKLSEEKTANEDLYRQAVQYYERLCTDKRKTTTSVAFFCDSEYRKNKDSFASANDKLGKKQREYMKTYNGSISCDGFKSIEEFEKEYENVSVHGLPELKERLEEARKTAKAEVKEHVFQNLKSSVDDARKNIRGLNKRLSENPFGDNTYTIKIMGAADGYEDLLDIVERYNPDDQMDIFSLDTGIKDEDFDNLITQIEEDPRKADYRNYLNIDIQVTRKIGDVAKNYMLSKVIGTNSGGETQIPFYILCAISILNVTTDKTVAQNMLLLNILDEAFDKMDTTSIQNTMSFYRALGFQTIISAPDSKNEILSDIMDNRIAVLNKSIHRGFKNIKSRAMLEFSKIKV